MMEQLLDKMSQIDNFYTCMGGKDKKEKENNSKIADNALKIL